MAVFSVDHECRDRPLRSAFDPRLAKGAGHYQFPFDFYLKRSGNVDMANRVLLWAYHKRDERMPRVYKTIGKHFPREIAFF